MIPTDFDQDALNDGRQSERALTVQRGVGRFLRAMNFACLAEMTLASGRRADLAAMGPKGEIWIIEIKSSVEDFRSDSKWPDYLEYCDRFFFATLNDVPLDIFPEEAGLIIADGFGAALLRDSPNASLPAARRKAMMLRYARMASLRLQDLADPGSRQGL
ncbi:MmcB family DNA repair protein [Coralliovum pocilloporae]|uniref:MmcB family DNA repair protein n=1 Tax=Coralliovum pocilloporae TaxID=3066369 RepID=UPI0033077DDA